MTAQTIPSLSFDSSTLPPEQQFPAQQGLMTSFRVSTPEPHKGFFARSSGWVVDGMVVNFSDLGPLTIERTAEMIRADSTQYYVAVVMLDGAVWEADFDGVETRVDTGETCLLDMSRPFRSESGPGQSITVLIPRQLLDEALPPRDIHGLVLDAPAGRLLTDYLAALVKRLPSLPASDAPAIARGTRDLLAATLSTAATRRVGDRSSNNLLLRAKRHVAQNLAADLSPDALSAALGVSRSTLFRAFEAIGSIDGFVRARRLARAHELLRRAEGPRTVSEIAYAVGFKTVAHFSRAFRDAYGYTARALQSGTAGVALPDFPASDLHRTYSSWLDGAALKR